MCVIIKNGKIAETNLANRQIPDECGDLLLVLEPELAIGLILVRANLGHHRVGSDPGATLS